MMAGDDYIYLDYAAATPLDPRVLAVMQPYLTRHFANPSSLHGLGRQQRLALVGARADVALVLGAKPTEVVFTGGSTEAVNLAVLGSLKDVERGAAVALAVEHESVMAAMKALSADKWMTRLVPVPPEGVVDMAVLRQTITDETSLVAAQYVNNETGVIQPVAAIGRMIVEIREDRASRGVNRALLFFCDAAQAGLESLSVDRLGVDLMSLGGSKFYGPAGSGVLYVKTSVTVRSWSAGGGQEDGRRGGTPNVAAAVGLAAALKLVRADRREESARQTQLRDWAWKELKKANSTLAMNGGRQRAAGYLNFCVPEANGETLVAYLDARKIAVATGSACTAANQEPSHVLLAMGRTRERAQSSLRVTIGRQTTYGQLEAFVGAMEQVVPRAVELSK